eukprot:m.234867 g.234867  ORF g.234867 m.234867 type:complete len:208 (+) comp19816_c0_seq1:27-650(+)
MAATSRSQSALARKAAGAKTEDPVEKLRNQCMTRGSAGILGLGRLFRIMDDDGSKSINYAEFKKGLGDYGVYLHSEAEYKDAFTRFDKNGDGTISFDEFLMALRPPMSQRRVDLIRMAFNKCDKTKDGSITIDDLRGVYNVRNHPKFVSGEMTEDQLFKEFLKTFDTPDNADGTITWEEFLNYYSTVSASIDQDSYFDLMMRKAWRL